MTENDPTASSVAHIGRIWPQTGPHNADTVASAALAVVALVQYINVATETRGPLDEPETVDDLLAALCVAALGLDQTFQQVEAAVDRQADDHGAAEEPAHCLAITVAEARDAAYDLSVRIATARQFSRLLASRSTDT